MSLATKRPTKLRDLEYQQITMRLRLRRLQDYPLRPQSSMTADRLESFTEHHRHPP